MKKYKIYVLFFVSIVLIVTLITAIFVVLSDDGTKHETTEQVKVSAYTTKKTPGYDQFHFSYPSGWSVNDSDGIYTVSKSNYSLIISQVEGGGEECIFEGNYDPEKEQLDFRAKEYVELDSQLGQFRYFMDSQNGEVLNYRFCGPGFGENDQNKYFILSNIGYMEFAAPVNPDGAIMDEMHGIIESFAFE